MNDALREALEALERLAQRARWDEPEGAFDEIAPDWAKDSFNDDCTSACGYCGAWMTVVRPGKVQCHNCSDGTDLGAIARSDFRRLTAAASGVGEIPPGWALVPVEITPAMAQKLESNFAECLPPSEVHAANWREAYRAMIAAAPTPPKTGET